MLTGKNKLTPKKSSVYEIKDERLVEEHLQNDLFSVKWDVKP